MSLLEAEEREEGFEDDETEHHGTSGFHNRHGRNLRHIVLSLGVCEEGEVSNARHDEMR